MNHDAPIHQLDRAKVGECLINAMATAAQLGHKSPRSTMKDYGGPDHLLSPEAQFVRDALSLGTEEIARRWFGTDMEHAGQYITRKLSLRRRRYLAERAVSVESLRDAEPLPQEASET